jgi:hypothetical protein
MVVCNRSSGTEAALREAKSLTRHRKKTDQLAETLRKVKRTERMFREWSRTLLLAQRAEKLVRQTAEMKLKMPISPVRREVWEAAIKLCEARPSFRQSERSLGDMSRPRSNCRRAPTTATGGYAETTPPQNRRCRPTPAMATFFSPGAPAR